MPGIITHSKLFQETVRQIHFRKKKNFLQKSIIALFSSDRFRRAALFGAIGPNIFDYIPIPLKKTRFMSDLSFTIHNGAAQRTIELMLNRINSSKDKNNEWDAVQRAYLYGYISHLTADSIIHPFVYFNSGFPDDNSPAQAAYFREQNLLFQYNIDNYYQFYEEKLTDLKFNLSDMIPLERYGRFNFLDKSVKALIMMTIEDIDPPLHKKMIWFTSKKDGAVYGDLDLLPLSIIKTYKYKFSQKRGRFDDIVKNLRKRGLQSSDYLIRYPRSKRFAKDALNLHKNRWQNPAGNMAARYDSIDNLFSAACEKTADIWEKIERCVYEKIDFNKSDYYTGNAYTGDEILGYDDMKIKEPVRLYL